jgi:hypothetical protein
VLASLLRFRRHVSAAGFGLVIVLFLLPLATVSSCGEQVDVSGPEVGLTGVAAVVSGQLADPSVWPLVALVAIPLLALSGFLTQLVPGRTSAPVTFALSTIGAIIAVAAGALLALNADWHWRSAFYAMTASFLPPGLWSAGEIFQRRHLPIQLPTRPSRRSQLVRYLGAVAIVAIAGWLYYGSLTRPHESATNSSSQFSNDTWVWTGTQWRLQSPKQRPPGRDSAGLTFDEGRGQVVLFGGIDHRDTWTWDGSNWTERNLRSAPDSSVGAMVYDNQLKEVVFIDESAHLWAMSAFDWRPIATTGGPRTLAYTGAAGTAVYAGYDQAHAQLVVLTNSWHTNGSSVYETWTWNLAGWHRAATETDAFFAGPDPSGTANLIYDSDGGQLFSIGRSAMWTWNGAVWSRLGKPFVGAGAGAYDTHRHKLIYLLRTSPAATWLWDGSTWAPSDVAIRWTGQDIAIAYDSKREVVVVFG